jgi:hypothetical protein
MSAKIKGVIFSVEDTLLRSGNGATDPQVFAEVTKLIRYLQRAGIQFVVTTNRAWIVGEAKQPLRDFLYEKWGEFPYFSLEQDPYMPARPKAAFTGYILAKMGWSDIETVYIGSTENDMRTAVNGNLLFLRATWYANQIDYGFDFDNPQAIGRFFDVFCRREHLWGFQINDGAYEYYALAPFSTMRDDFKAYSMDAVAAAKQGRGHMDFWVGALVSSLYFSGLHKRIDYIAGYPGHKQGSANAMDRAMAVFGKCFRKKFLPDLIVRHTTSTKMQTARNTGILVGHKTQLDTIKLNRAPMKSATARYTASPLGPGKTVLLVDDICTRGYSLEAARTFVEQTGTGVIMVSWLKTINTSIEKAGQYARFDPYQATVFTAAAVAHVYDYRTHLTSREAPDELDRMLKAYDTWTWPT